MVRSNSLRRRFEAVGSYARQSVDWRRDHRLATVATDRWWQTSPTFRRIVFCFSLFVTVLFCSLTASSAAEPPSTREAKEPTAGLVAHWRFDDGEGSTAADSSGNGYAAVIHHAEWIEGRDGRGKALRFDGQRAWVDCGNVEVINSAKQCTVEAWIKPEEPRLHNMTIVAKGYRYRCLFNLQMGIPWDRSKLVFGVGAYQTHEKPIPFGEWSHVAGVCDGQRVATFVNGKLQLIAVVNN